MPGQDPSACMTLGVQGCQSPELTTQDGRALIAPLAELGARVIVVTGETDRFELAACLEAGAIGVASKKESIASVIAKVCRALDGEPVTALPEQEELLSGLRHHRLSERSRMSVFSHLTRREQAVLLAEAEEERQAADTELNRVLQSLGVSEVSHV